MRPTKPEYFLTMASLVSTMGTCSRRQVGCVLVNSKFHVLATGYNGVPRGHTHCTDKPCAGTGFKSGEGLDKCQAVHAEQNALLQCHDVEEIHTAFVTVSPCIHCVKLLLNTSCRRIVFSENYPHGESAEIWMNSGREWFHSPI